MLSRNPVIHLKYIIAVMRNTETLERSIFVDKRGQTVLEVSQLPCTMFSELRVVTVVRIVTSIVSNIVSNITSIVSNK